MNDNDEDSYLLDKYCIPSMGTYSQPGSELCEILFRLEESSKLEDADKQWIKDKGMFSFFNFIKKWEETGKPDFKSLESNKYAKNKYGLYIRSPKSYLNKVLQRINKGERFLKKDAIWLIKEDLMKGELKLEYHYREANFYLNNEKIKKDLWNIVNACSNFRKAEASKKAIEITDNINYKKIKDKHLKSALSVTRGGAFRDLGQLEHGL